MGSPTPLAHVLEEALDGEVASQVFRPALVGQANALRHVVEIHVPGDVLLGEPIEDAHLLLLEPAGQGEPMASFARHVGLALGRAAEGEDAVGPRRSGNRGEPAVADQKIVPQGMQRRQCIQRKVRHDELPLLDRAVRERAHEVGDEAAVVVGQLAADVFHIVPRIEVHLPLGRGALAVFLAVSTVDARPVRVNAFELRIDALEAAEHVVEGAVLEEQEDDVPDGIVRRMVWVHGCLRSWSAAASLPSVL